MTPSTTSTSPTSAEKHEIAGQFDRVSARYDLMCALNPGYTKHLRRSAERLELGPGARVLDLCCGTGLSTAALLATWADLDPRPELLGLDISVGMLGHARQKPALEGVAFFQGDATDPRAAGIEGEFDGIFMAYGIRNVPDPDLCLARLFELLRPGGVLCLHEYSVADSRRSRAVWNAVTGAIVIPLALPVTGSTEIFRYLRRSVLEFDGVAQLEARLESAGFTQVETLPMDGWQRGIEHTFRARRPRA